MKKLLLTIIATGLFALTACSGEDTLVADDTTPDYVADVDVDVVEDEVYDDEEIDALDDIERPIVDGFPEHLLAVTTEEIIVELGEPYEIENLTEHWDHGGDWNRLTWYVRSSDGYLQRLVADIDLAGTDLPRGEFTITLEDDVVRQITLVYLDNRNNTTINPDAIAQVLAADSRHFMPPPFVSMTAEEWEELNSRLMPISEATALLGEPSAITRSVIAVTGSSEGVLLYTEWQRMSSTFQWGLRADLAGNYIVTINTRSEVGEYVNMVSKLRQVDGEWVPVTIWEWIDGEWVRSE